MEMDTQRLWSAHTIYLFMYISAFSSFSLSVSLYFQRVKTCTHTKTKAKIHFIVCINIFLEKQSKKKHEKYTVFLLHYIFTCEKLNPFHVICIFGVHFFFFSLWLLSKFPCIHLFCINDPLFLTANKKINEKFHSGYIFNFMFSAIIPYLCMNMCIIALN